jgi:aminoglycoside/choline kinase family phosphotransferase
MAVAAPEAGVPEAALRRLLREALDAEAQSFEPIAGQIGLRRFVRVRLTPREGLPATLVARIEAREDPASRPAGAAPEPPLEPVRGLLERHGLPVPARYGGDPAAGIELLEDAGDHSLAAAVADADAATRRALYAEVCALVPRIQRIPAPTPPVAAFERRLDPGQIAYKASRFLEWSLPTRGRAASAAEAAAVRAGFDCVAEAVRRAPLRLAHRDLQSSNVHVRRDRPAGARIVLLDLQGAWLAPPEYDLVCLLRDSYVELPAAEIAEQLARVRPALPDAPAAEELEHRFDLLTLSRKGKDHALFHFVARTRGDRRYLRFVPATVRHLRAAAARAAGRDPRLAPLAALVAELPEAPCAR